MCVIALKSMTYALKAQKILNEYYFNSEIVKLEPQMTIKGCAYGIKFNCDGLADVQKILRKKSIKYSELINM